MAVVNPDKTVTESDAANDTNDVQYIAIPDIQMVSADLLSPSSVTFAYSTTEDPGIFTVGLYYSADGVTYDPATPITSQIISPSGVNATGVGSFDLSQFLTTDILEPYLIVVANPDHGSVEYDYSNDLQTINGFCHPGDIHPNVLLPEINYDIPIQ